MSILERTRVLAATEPSRALRLLPAFAVLTDLAVILLTVALAVVGRSRLEVFPNPYAAVNLVGAVAPLLIVGWIACIAAFGGYDRRLFGSGTDEVKRIVRASLFSAGLVGIACYLTKFQLSRGFFVLSFLIGLPLLLLGRVVLRVVLQRARRRGLMRVRVLVAGDPGHIDEITGVLHSNPWLGYSVVGAVTPRTALTEETATGVPVLGFTDEVVSVAQSVGTDMIFFASGSLASGREMRERVWELEKHAIGVAIAPSVSDVSSGRVAVRPVGGLPLLHLEHPTWARAGRLGKRIFDLVGACLLILALSPLFAVAAAQIWLHDRGPLFFRHQRVGRNGERFGCLKFRTMVVNAEAVVTELQEATNQSALLFKMKDDPRITRPGKWLRRFSVDELPQLFNVVRGDMSLVGPRPQVQREVDLYQDGMERRLLVRPGMTGLWQVSGRNDLSAEESCRLDLFYVDNWSMLQDLGILFRTFGAVVGSRGAY